MATQAQAPLDENNERRRVYTNWKAGIVEDAQVLHLAGKPMFAPMVAALLEDSDVVAAFCDSAVDAENALRCLELVLTKSLGYPVTARRDTRLPASATEQP